MPIDRRTLLKYGLFGTAVLTVGGIGLTLRPTAMVTPRSPLKVLTEQEYSIFVAFADAVLTGEEGWPDHRALGIVEEIDAGLEPMHPGIIGEVKALLGVLESALAGVVLDARVSTFSACSLEKRCAIVESWRTARTEVFRIGFLALQGFVVAPYYNRPEVAAKIGYPGMPAWIHERRVMP
ncbi:MAG: hypothetical protein GY898_33485 [Proteobacteria bacterium]|nr:hypothetical protein [Pseudomonadota bacterium]